MLKTQTYFFKGRIRMCKFYTNSASVLRFWLSSVFTQTIFFLLFMKQTELFKLHWNRLTHIHRKTLVNLIYLLLSPVGGCVVCALKMNSVYFWWKRFLLHSICMCIEIEWVFKVFASENTNTIILPLPSSQCQLIKLSG